MTRTPSTYQVSVAGSFRVAAGALALVAAKAAAPLRCLRRLGARTSS